MPDTEFFDTDDTVFVSTTDTIWFGDAQGRLFLTVSVKVPVLEISVGAPDVEITAV